MTKIPMPADLPDVEINPNAKIVLEKRYFVKGSDGELQEDARALFWRVASSMAAEETKYRKSPWKKADLARAFYDLMTSYRFLPNSPTLMNAGTEVGQLAACFVLPVGDSIEEIFDAVKYAAMIHKSGGGTGFSFSRLRPKDSRVGTTGGVASGPLSFLRIFNCATEQVKQGGRRRGANMGILRIDHPDIIEFIRAKEKDGELSNFNLSVGLTEAFMEAVGRGEDYELRDPATGEVSGTQNAREVFELLVDRAWRSGDPGIVFLDRINRDNPTPLQGEMESTNPCGEQPLLPYEACNLGSVNLSKFFLPEAEGKPADRINWEGLRETVHLSVRFLDNVIDASKYPLESIAEKVRLNRKIGLGLMGWADLLFRLGVPYDSREAVDLGREVMKFLREESRSASKTLASERGAFPAFEGSVFDRKNLGPYRNATVTTIAPTGTLSIIAGCSSGIEPLFALCFSRHVMDGEKLMEVNPFFEQALRDAQCHSAALMEDVARKGSVSSITHLPEDIRRVFVTAMDISPEWHLKMQAAFQEFTDNAVSKTVNLPGTATREDIAAIYQGAYESGCKGVTVYRDGCKDMQVLCTGDTPSGETPDPDAAAAKVRRVMDRPETVFGFTTKIGTGLGDMYLTVNEVDGRPFEVFANLGKSGRSITAKAEAIGRLVSLALRSGINVEEVVKQLKGIGGEHPVYRKKGLLLSIPDAIAWVLESRYMDKPVPAEDNGNGLSRPSCPECGEELVFQEGCFMCPQCSYTKCG